MYETPLNSTDETALFTSEAALPAAEQAIAALPRSEHGTGTPALALLAARACEAPVALVLALEHGHTVLRSGTGFDPAECEGLLALCSTVLEPTQRLPVLPADCAPGILFFHSVMLKGPDGVPRGLLAVMDRVQRH